MMSGEKTEVGNYERRGERNYERRGEIMSAKLSRFTTYEFRKGTAYNTMHIYTHPVAAGPHLYHFLFLLIYPRKSQTPERERAPPSGYHLSRKHRGHMDALEEARAARRAERQRGREELRELTGQHGRRRISSAGGALGGLSGQQREAVQDAEADPVDVLESAAQTGDGLDTWDALWEWRRIRIAHGLGEPFEAGGVFSKTAQSWLSAFVQRHNLRRVRPRKPEGKPVEEVQQVWCRLFPFGCFFFFHSRPANVPPFGFEGVSPPQVICRLPPPSSRISG